MQFWGWNKIADTLQNQSYVWLRAGYFTQLHTQLHKLRVHEEKLTTLTWVNVVRQVSIHPQIKTTDISQRAIPKILFIWWCNSQMKVRVYFQLSVNLGYMSLCQLKSWNRLFDGQVTFLLLLMFNELKPAFTQYMRTTGNTNHNDKER